VHPAPTPAPWLFDKGSATRKAWFYQLDPGRSLGKTNPLNDDDLAEFVKLQKPKAYSSKSWTVDAKTIDQTTFDLSVKNPNGNEEVAHRSPKNIMLAAWPRSPRLSVSDGVAAKSAAKTPGPTVPEHRARTRPRCHGARPSGRARVPKSR
jgi:hypothetical protein